MSAVVTEVETDVLVVGAGVAGLSVAAGLAGARRVLLVSDGEGSTPWAQGGVAAAYAAADDPRDHARDTQLAGSGACDPVALACLTEEGPQRLAELVAAGARFDRDRDGRLEVTREGGHGRRRVVHAGGDATGAEVHRVLTAATSSVPRLAGRATALLVAGGAVVGAAVETTGGTTRVRARATVLATGGLGHAYPTTTNPAGVTGDGLALAALAGATLGDLEFVQFHPTALHTGGSGQVPLVTEALRGEGAVLRDAEGVAFMRARHPDGDLAPRDVVARAVHEVGGGGPVVLDTRGLRDLAARFPTVAASCAAYGVDVAAIPVAPAQHYLCGGVLTDRWGATDVPGLHAVGEVAATGVHGANRLASNSLLEGLVFGRRVAARLVLELPPAVVAEPRARALAPPTEVSDQARRLLGSAGGLVRDGSSLAGALDRLLARPAPEVTWLVATAVLSAAAARRGSRGCHLRADAVAEPSEHRVRVRVDADGVPQVETRERAA